MNTASLRPTPGSAETSSGGATGAEIAQGGTFSAGGVDARAGSAGATAGIGGAGGVSDLESAGKAGNAGNAGDGSGGNSGAVGGALNNGGGVSGADTGGSTNSGGTPSEPSGGTPSETSGGTGPLAQSGGTGGVGGSQGGGNSIDTSVVIDPTVSCLASMPGMVCIEGATFTMGDDSEGQARHRASVKAFYIDANEVTVQQYDACSKAGACVPAALPASDPDARLMGCNEGVYGHEKHPINCIRWDGADQYCHWVGGRLPTEEEWVYATQRGRAQYPWGTDTSDLERRVNLSSASDGFITTSPVGSFPAGATSDGINDLLGNVWEFLESRYCAFPTAACLSCAASQLCDNRCDACATEFHAVRGGSSWDTDLTWSIHQRGDWSGGPFGAYAEFVGFRCARSVTTSGAESSP